MGVHSAERERHCPPCWTARASREMFQPLCLLLALWCLLYFVEQPLSRIVQAQFGLRNGGVARRHESVLYWFDSNWLSVFVILIGILAFDLVDRRFTHSLWLPAMAVVGGILGQFAQMGIVRGGFSDWLHDVLVHTQGPRSGVDSNLLVTNWPVLFAKGSDYIGAALGIMLATGLYFYFFGKFRRGSSLFLHMALGWFVGFLLLPVLFDIRMTPPRGDNWAGILGAYVGVLIYSIRHKLWPIVVASLVTGTIGGLGLSLIACLQSLLLAFGNGNLGPGLGAAWTQWQISSPTSAPIFPEFFLNTHPAPGWQFWQAANWHSFLEQSYGFINGIGVIVAMALLVNRTESVGERDEAPALARDRRLEPGRACTPVRQPGEGHRRLDTHRFVASRGGRAESDADALIRISALGGRLVQHSFWIGGTRAGDAVECAHTEALGPPRAILAGARATFVRRLTVGICDRELRQSPARLHRAAAVDGRGDYDQRRSGNHAPVPGAGRSASRVPAPVRTALAV